MSNTCVFCNSSVGYHDEPKHTPDCPRVQPGAVLLPCNCVGQWCHDDCVPTVLLADGSLVTPPRTPNGSDGSAKGLTTAQYAGMRAASLWRVTGSATPIWGWLEKQLEVAKAYGTVANADQITEFCDAFWSQVKTWLPNHRPDVYGDLELRGTAV